MRKTSDAIAPPSTNDRNLSRQPSLSDNKNLGREFKNIKRFYQISRIGNFTEKLWYHGVYVGDFKGEFIVENDFFYKQMICGVLDGVTILKSAQLIMQKEGSNWFTNTIPKEVIIQLINYFNFNM